MDKRFDEFSEMLFERGVKCHQSKQELRVVLGIIERLRPRVVLEIGTAYGGWCCHVARICPKDTLFIGIDAHEKSEQQTAAEIIEGFGSKYERVVGYSQALKTVEAVDRLLPRQMVDVLHLDGSHKDEAVRKDWALYGALIRPGGIAILHDIAFRPVDREHPAVEVEGFWNELRYQYQSLAVIGEPLGPWHLGTGILLIETDFATLLARE